MRGADCTSCGAWPCICVEAECRRCKGEGEHAATWNGGPDGAGYVRCDDCEGEGWIKCQRGGSNCPFERCYCEAAWERQQEANAAEPPPTAAELHQRAHDERQGLRSGRPL